MQINQHLMLSVSDGLVVNGWDSLSRGCEFESLRWILNGQFSHQFVLNFALFDWADLKSTKRGRGWPIYINIYTKGLSDCFKDKYHPQFWSSATENQSIKNMNRTEQKLKNFKSAKLSTWCDGVARVVVQLRIPIGPRLSHYGVQSVRISPVAWFDN